MTCNIRFDLVTTECQWFFKEDGDHAFVISHDKKSMSMNAYGGAVLHCKKICIQYYSL